jgi:tetratricopeptide (TPR) repeat protein
LRLSPGHAPTYYNRASAYRAKGQTTDAIADYRKVLALDPSMTQAKAKLQDLGVSQP